MKRYCLKDGTIFDDDPAREGGERFKCPTCALRKEMQEEIQNLKDEILSLTIRLGDIKR